MNQADLASDVQASPNTTKAEVFYKQMFMIRKVEESFLSLFSQGLLNGTVHTCMGQEACAVGVVNALDKSRDIVFSNHRGHGHFLSYTDDIEGLIGELLGRTTGVSGGIGGSQNLQANGFYSSGVQGGIVPISTGMAFAEKAKKTGAVVAVFLGDGTLGEGVVYESFNIAAKWALPVLFVVENNLYAQTTHVQLVHAGSLSERAIPFGIRTVHLKEDDVFSIHSAASDLTDKIRSEMLPSLLYLETYRLGPHSKGDDFRPSEEVESYRKVDPLRRLANLLDASRRQELECAVNLRVEIAIKTAMAMPEQKFGEYHARMIQLGVYA